jgi:hypothetical protein
MITEVQKQLSIIMGSISEELDIPESKYEDAKQKYEAVGNWLGNSSSELSEYNPKIFPQGSFRLGTCVKPIGQDEYDIDLVCKLHIPSNSNQSFVYNLVGERLKENGIYLQKLEPQNRCWRLNYAGDFHLDILPAIPDNSSNNSSIFVPDKELEYWQPSNPEGYAEWFYSCMAIRVKELKEAEIEDIPEFKIKTPLQKSIQLLKRHRDIVFKNDLKDKPISIILTTLAAKAYQNEANLFDALINIIRFMPYKFDEIDGEIAVLNPTNEEENFADKWKKHPQRKVKFLQWLSTLKTSLDKMFNLKESSHVYESLMPMFGNNIIESALMRSASKMESLREKNELKIMPQIGLLGITGIQVKRNTFYGE